MATHSFSSLKYFSGCPRRYAEVKIYKRFKDTPYKAKEDGKILHEAFENAIKFGTPLPEHLLSHKEQMDMISELTGQKYCELKMGLTEQCTPCEYFDSEAWIRGAADFVYVEGESATVADWKTGSDKYPDPAQLHLMALCVMKRFPGVKRVTGVLVFVDAKTVHSELYEAEQIPMMWAYWVNKMRKQEAAIERADFPPNPTGLCKGYCPVTACEHWAELPAHKRK